MEMLTCKHCKEIISYFDDIPNHQCFIRKNVYMTDDHVLYTEEDSSLVNDVETEAEYLDQPSTSKQRNK